VATAYAFKAVTYDFKSIGRAPNMLWCVAIPDDVWNTLVIAYTAGATVTPSTLDPLGPLYGGASGPGIHAFADRTGQEVSASEACVRIGEPASASRPGGQIVKARLRRPDRSAVPGDREHVGAAGSSGLHARPSFPSSTGTATRAEQRRHGRDVVAPVAS
jgi:hypothetical protein